MRLAYFGDLVGTPGRRVLMQHLAAVRETHGADLIVANVENVADGSGVTPEQVKKLRDAGLDGMTLGDHAFRKQQIAATLREADNLIRPVNLPGRAWGRGWMQLTCRRLPDAPPVVVCVVMGRLFMNAVQADDPFAAVDRLLESLRGRGCITVIEFHAEATSEKVAMGWHCNGRVAAVVGTHTHVPTADARLLPSPGSDLSLPSHGETLRGSGGASGGRTAYVTDLGMTGAQDSVLGRRADRVLHHMTTGLPAAFDVADANPVAHGVLIDLDPQTRLATAIERIALPADLSAPPFAA